jgi:hypothetical protein
MTSDKRVFSLAAVPDRELGDPGPQASCRPLCYGRRNTKPLPKGTSSERHRKNRRCTVLPWTPLGSNWTGSAHSRKHSPAMNSLARPMPASPQHDSLPWRARSSGVKARRSLIGPSVALRVGMNLVRLGSCRTRSRAVRKCICKRVQAGGRDRNSAFASRRHLPWRSEGRQFYGRARGTDRRKPSTIQLRWFSDASTDSCGAVERLHSAAAEITTSAPHLGHGREYGNPMPQPDSRHGASSMSMSIERPSKPLRSAALLMVAAPLLVGATAQQAAKGPDSQATRAPKRAAILQILEEAARSADDLKDPQAKASMFVAIPSAQARVGDHASRLMFPGRAVQAAVAVIDLSQRASALDQIAVAEVDSGDPAAARSTLRRAFETANIIRDDHRRNSTKMDLAVTHARAGDVDLALRLVAELPESSHYKSRALPIVLGGLNHAPPEVQPTGWSTNTPVRLL